MRSRWKTLAVAAALAAAFSATESLPNTSFVAPYGGYAWNDGDTAPQNAIIYGITAGVENAAGGAILNLDFNRDGGTGTGEFPDKVEMNSLSAAFLLNFVSKDTRRARKFIRNRFSSWLRAGTGIASFQRGDRDDSLRLMWEAGIGLQYRFTRNFGLRFDALTLFLPAGNNLVYEGRLGLGFYWGQGR